MGLLGELTELLKLVGYYLLGDELFDTFEPLLLFISLVP